MRKKRELASQAKDSREGEGASRFREKRRMSWAALIRKVYEVDPLRCPECGGEMKVVSFIEKCQAEVVEKI
ncbi:MAG: hypothetical protein ACUVTG_09445 [Candidatus Oleimicrobiaceae bacterium]